MKGGLFRGVEAEGGGGGNQSGPSRGVDVLLFRKYVLFVSFRSFCFVTRNRPFSITRNSA
jgi:hypothetical protein